MKKSWLIFLLLGFFMLQGCAEKIYRGVVVKPYQLRELTVGQSNYQDVLNALGTPSTVSDYDPGIWYYISQTKTDSFISPDFRDQEVYQVRLNNDGIYLGYRKYDKDDVTEIAVSQQKTPTVARNKSFLQEIVSNFGRYSRPGGSDAGTPNPARNLFNQNGGF